MELTSARAEGIRVWVMLEGPWCGSLPKTCRERGGEILLILKKTHPKPTPGAGAGDGVVVSGWQRGWRGVAAPCAPIPEAAGSHSHSQLIPAAKASGRIRPGVFQASPLTSNSAADKALMYFTSRGDGRATSGDFALTPPLISALKNKEGKGEKRKKKKQPRSRIATIGSDL